VVVVEGVVVAVVGGLVVEVVVLVVVVVELVAVDVVVKVVVEPEVEVVVGASVEVVVLSRGTLVVVGGIVVPGVPGPGGGATWPKIPMIGQLSFIAPVDPWNLASPKENTPPSLATNQYPNPPGDAAIPTIG